MKKSITLSLVLAATMGLAACGEKAADDAATTETPATETVEGAADGAMQAAEGAADPPCWRRRGPGDRSRPGDPRLFAKAQEIAA